MVSERLMRFLMNRDNIDYEIARARIQETIDEIINDPQDIEEIINENLHITYKEYCKYE